MPNLVVWTHDIGEGRSLCGCQQKRGESEASGACNSDKGGLGRGTVVGEEMVI